LPDRHDEDDTTRATATLPGLNIEIVHRQSTDGDAEQISINLQAVPSFEALGRFLEAANPFVFWAQLAQLAWLPWLEAARSIAQALSVAPPQLYGRDEHRTPSRSIVARALPPDP
jgi:hypothetical protein